MVCSTNSWLKQRQMSSEEENTFAEPTLWVLLGTLLAAFIGEVSWCVQKNMPPDPLCPEFGLLWVHCRQWDTSKNNSGRDQTRTTGERKLIGCADTRKRGRGRKKTSGGIDLLKVSIKAGSFSVSAPSPAKLPTFFSIPSPVFQFLCLLSDRTLGWSSSFGL